MIDAILTNTVLPAISQEFLTRLMEGRQVKNVHVSVADSGFRYAFDGAVGSGTT
jgi:type VI secretion system protein VasG